MADTSEGRPLMELIGGLANDISTLFRKEIQLAKAEASEKLSDATGALTSIVIGIVLVLGALGVFLAGLVALLTSLLVNMGMDPILANAVSAVIVAAVVGIAGWTSLSKGLDALKASNLNMKRTAASLSRDADIVKERL